MEDLRRAALAYYNNSSEEMKNLVWKFFQSMDIDRDGRVSYAEFAHFIQWNGYGWVEPRSLYFAQLDTDSDGGLDFWEVLTFYYAVKTRGVWCRQCCKHLCSLYFTCVECFDKGRPFDLCSDCFGARSFRHEHRNRFLDSFVLLRSKIGVAPGTNVDQAITQPQTNRRPGFVANYAFMALELALAVGQIAGGIAACAIM